MQALTAFATRHPWWVIAVLGALTLWFALQIPGLHTDPRIEIFIPAENPVRALYSQNQDNFATYEEAFVGLVAEDIYTPGSLGKLHALCADIETLPLVDQVTSLFSIDMIEGGPAGLQIAPLVANGQLPRDAAAIAALRQRIAAWDFYQDLVVTRDQRGALISFTFEQGTETDDITPLYHRLEKIADTYRGPERVFISGTPMVSALTGEYMLRDMQIFVPFVNIVIVTALFLFFRSLRGVVLPLLTVSVATIWTFGLMARLGIPVTTVTSALPVILVAIGSAYGIHVLENVMAEQAAATPDGIQTALARVGLPVVMAGLTTMAGFASLLTSEVVPIGQMGTLAAFGTAVALVVSLSLIPAILALLQAGGLAPPRSHARRDLAGRFLGAVARVLASHSRAILGLSLALLVASVLASLLLVSDMDPVRHFRRSSPIRQADIELNEVFGGTSVFNVVVRSDADGGIKDPALLQAVAELQDRLGSIDGVGKVVSVVDLVKKMNQAMHDGDPAYYIIPPSRELVAQYLLLYSFAGGEALERFVDYDERSTQIILQLKSQSASLAEEVLAAIAAFRQEHTNPQAEIFATGIAALVREFNRIVVAGQISSFLTSLVLVMLITAFIFGSLKLGALSILPLGVPILINFGIMGILGITLNAATAMIACVTIGVGIDYSIHFLARWRHETAAGAPMAAAIETAVHTSGRAILYNALAVAAGFLVLLPSNFVPIVQMGLLTALVMLTSALAAITLLPAALIVFKPRIDRGHTRMFGYRSR